MTSEREPIEYPDEAGYPDGRGFLDEGTAAGEPKAEAQPAAPSLDEVEEFAMSDEEDDEPEGF